MSTRSLVLLSFVATCFTVAPAAYADVPNPSGSSTSSTVSSSGSATSSTTGGGGSTTTTTTTTTTSGAGGSSANDPNCSIAEEAIAGTTCKECDPSSSCNTVGTDYSFVCQRTSSVQVWCNGPNRNTPMDQNVACAVSFPGNGWTGAAGGALALVAALLLRRRRRG